MEDKKRWNITRKITSAPWILFLSAILLPLAGNAAHAGAIKLETVVVSAPTEEGTDVTEETIDSKRLKTHKIVDLAEILSDEMTEAALIRKSMYGNEVSLRGFGKSNLRVLIDGTIIEGAFGGRKNPSLSLLSTLAIEKLVVREGPFDATEPGALGGSIDVIEKRNFLRGTCSIFGWATPSTDIWRLLWGLTISLTRRMP